MLRLVLFVIFWANVCWTVSATDTSKPRCGKNEQWTPCPSCGPKTCKDLGFPMNCPMDSGAKCAGPACCTCIDDYVRADNGTCIKKIDCKICGGDHNAQSGCGNCRKTCADYKRTDIMCTMICYSNACDCKPGYVLDTNTGKCVLPNECTPTCGQGEEYTSCLGEGCRGATYCSEIKNGGTVPVTCKNIKDCYGGCQCKKGYLRNDNGICVPKNECNINEKCSGKQYQFWDPCAPNCVAETCDQIGKTIKCLPQATVCKGRCRCAQGYYKDPQGYCIQEDQCPKPCYNVGEQWDYCVNGGCRRRSCNDTGILCIDPTRCIGGCRCKDNWYKNDKGICVPADKCRITCGKNEVLDECHSSCPPRVCGTSDAAVLCLAVEPKDCKPGCRCKDGYSRNQYGECIPTSSCPPTCPGLNEEWNPCYNPCDPNTCESIGQKYNCPMQPADKNCKGACRCKTGFYRNRLGYCISKENCLKCTKPNEYYSCGGACDNLCYNLSTQNQTVCPWINIKCNEMCYCIKGYARNRKGYCVPFAECKGNCKGQYEWHDSCPSNCPPSQNCDTYGQTYSCPAEPNKNCQPCCRCEDKYLRNKDGKCIPQEQCPCKDDPNAKPGCSGCEKTCSNCNSTTPIVCDNSCGHKVCICKDGYVRDESTGKCVLPKNCSTCKGDPNEKPGCSACEKTCSNYKSTNSTNCISICVHGSCSPLCINKSCTCKEGYVRNESTGKCVLPQNCPIKCTKPNEHYACGGACDNVCSLMSTQNQTNCPVVNVKCNDMCYCNKGFARNRNGDCVPISECKGNCKGQYEWHDSCPSNCPPSQNCDTYGQTYSCPAEPNKNCQPCCRCEDNFLRDKHGKCIRQEECPCKDDPNAKPGCCGKTCSNYKSITPIVCNKMCTKGSCTCKDGYVLNERTGKCILPKYCPSAGQCGVNERWECRTKCQSDLCLSITAKIYCPPEEQCQYGCYCKDGLFRQKQGLPCRPTCECTEMENSPDCPK